jgi:hypothetical protein
VWRFNTKPAPGEPGADTWGAIDAKAGGGAVWTPFSLDPAQGLVFVPVGNPAPDYWSEARPGANLLPHQIPPLISPGHEAPLTARRARVVPRMSSLIAQPPRLRPGG